ncbi:Eisosome assembly protein [Microsporum audouinii]
MASRIRPTSAPVGPLRIDPDSEDAASAAALYVTQPERTGFRTSSGLRPASSKRFSKDAGDYDLSPAGAAASYVTRGSYPRPGQSTKQDVSSISKKGEERLSSIGSKTAYRSFRDSGVSGFGDETIKEGDSEAKMAATGAMSTSRKRVESMASPSDGVSDLAGALSAATISHRVSQHGRPTTEKKVEFQINPKKLYNPAVTNIRREMYTSHPPVAVTLDENRKRDTLQAAAVSMAQQMYAIIPKEDLQDIETSSFTMEEPEGQASHRQSLQRGREGDELEASSSLARSSNYRPRPQYFAATRVRPLSSSSADSGRYFGRQAKQARSQSRRNKHEVYYDNNTIDAAQRNVKKMMENIDNHIYNYHSRPSPAIMREWERQANERVLANRDPSSFEVGPEQMRAGEPLVPARNVDDMARARVRPALYDIDDQVAARKSRRITDKLDEERYHRFISSQMTRDKEVHQLNKIIIDALRHPEKEKQWTQDAEREKNGYESDEDEISTWPYPPKRIIPDAESDQTIFQALDEGRAAPQRPPRPSTPPEQLEEPSEPILPPDETADGVDSVQEGVAAEQATNEETTLTEQAGSQAKHVRRHKAVHKTWFTKPSDSDAEDEPPREVERIEERIVTEIEKERPATPIHGASSIGDTTPMATGALGVPESPHPVPSSHWSSSNESGPGSGRGSPRMQKQDDIERSKKRLGLPHLFHRHARRSGNQGSFSVNRRSVPEASPPPTSTVPGQSAGESVTTPGSRLSRFQENL